MMMSLEIDLKYDPFNDLRTLVLGYVKDQVQVGLTHERLRTITCNAYINRVGRA